MDVEEIEFVLRDPLPDPGCCNRSEEDASDRAVVRDRDRSAGRDYEFVSQRIFVVDRSQDRDSMSLTDQEIGEVADVYLDSTW